MHIYLFIFHSFPIHAFQKGATLSRVVSVTCPSIKECLLVKNTFLHSNTTTPQTYKNKHNTPPTMTDENTTQPQQNKRKGKKKFVPLSDFKAANTQAVSASPLSSSMSSSPITTVTPPEPALVAPVAVKPQENEEEGDDGEGLCFICAEEISCYAVGECNHRVCHLCSLRLRALYKQKTCAYCKVR